MIKNRLQISLVISRKSEIICILEVKFVNDSYVKLHFYDIIDCKTTAGCQNLMYILLNLNLNNKYILCSGKHGEHSG